MMDAKDYAKARVDLPLIVVVDDSWLVRQWLLELLLPAGYQVQAFPDGRHLAGWLQEHPQAQPALWILDVRLPGPSGYIIARRLRSIPRYAGGRILLYSRSDGPRECLLARIAGADRLVSKACSAEQVLEQVRELLKGAS